MFNRHCFVEIFLLTKQLIGMVIILTAPLSRSWEITYPDPPDIRRSAPLFEAGHQVPLFL